MIVWLSKPLSMEKNGLHTRSSPFFILRKSVLQFCNTAMVIFQALISGP